VKRANDKRRLRVIAGGKHVTAVPNTLTEQALADLPALRIARAYLNAIIDMMEELKP
jgi:hypothetical protein